jgi:hypothetical protein
MATDTVSSNSSPEPTTPVICCGITFSSDVISGPSVDGLRAEVVRPEITGLAIHSVVSRSRAITQIIGSIVMFGLAGAVGLSAIGAIHLLGNSFLGSRGIHVVIIIALVGPAVRLFSTAWDPRHVLVVMTSRGAVTLDLQPTPEPFQLIKTLDEIQQRLGYKVELWPENRATHEGAS